MASSAGQGAGIAGPAAAGLLQVGGDALPYLASMVALAAAAALALAVPHEVGTAHVAGRDQEPTVGDALAGVRLILRTPALLGAISLDLVAVLFGGATALLPVFARDVLHVGAFGNGLLRAAPGVGAVLVGVVLPARPINERVGRALLGAVAAFGVFTVVFALSRSFLLSFVALAALAGADMVSMFLRGTLVPLLTPPELRGRVSAVESVFIGASNELGAFESGVAAALVRAVPAVLVGGLVSIAVAAVWAWRFPTLRGVDRFADVRPAAVR
jgi:MFS transporter